MSNSDRAGRGDLVKDKITGYEGIVVGVHEYLNGCVQLSVQAEKLKDHEPVKAIPIDISQVEIVQKEKIKPAPIWETNAPATASPPGGPGSALSTSQPVR